MAVSVEQILQAVASMGGDTLEGMVLVTHERPPDDVEQYLLEAGLDYVVRAYCPPDQVFLGAKDDFLAPGEEPLRAPEPPAVPDAPPESLTAPARASTGFSPLQTIPALARMDDQDLGNMLTMIVAILSVRQGEDYGVILDKIRDLMEEPNGPASMLHDPEFRALLERLIAEGQGIQ